MNFNAPTMMGGPSMPTPPNEAKFNTNDKAGSFPQPESGGKVSGPNQTSSGDRRNGTMPMGGSSSPINPPNAMGARVNGGPGRG